MRIIRQTSNRISICIFPNTTLLIPEKDQYGRWAYGVWLKNPQSKTPVPPKGGILFSYWN
jgi:hypothetical protein